MRSIITPVIICLMLAGLFRGWLWARDQAVREAVVTDISDRADRQTRAIEAEIDQIKKDVESLPSAPDALTDIERLCKSDPHCSD